MANHRFPLIITKYSRDIDREHTCHPPGLAWPKLGLYTAPQGILASDTDQDATSPGMEHFYCAPLSGQRIRNRPNDVVRDRQAIVSNAGIVLISNKTFSGVNVNQKLIIRSEEFGGDHLTRDDFDWNQSVSPQTVSPLTRYEPVWDLSGPAIILFVK